MVVIASLSTIEIKAQNEALQWEPNIQRFEQQDASRTYDPHSIMFIGSSSIMYWQTIENDMKPYPVIQRGFGGSKLTDVNYYLNRLITPKHQLDAVVIYAANDIKGVATDKTPKEVKKIFKQTVKGIRKINKDDYIFYVEVTPTPARMKVWDKNKEANRLISKVCKHKKNVEYIETSSKYLDNFKEPRKELFRSDGIHFNQDGYNLWAEIIKTELNKYIPQNLSVK